MRALLIIVLMGREGLSKSEIELEPWSPQSSSLHCFDSVILALPARRILSSKGERMCDFCLKLNDYGPNSNHRIYKGINTEEIYRIMECVTFLH